MRRSERGVSLVELTVAIAMATIVMLGIVLFYLNSNSTWLDASTQAITQRDGTLVIEHMAKQGRRAAAATVDNVPDSNHQRVTFYSDPAKANEICHYFWTSSDSMIHWGVGGTDNGRLVQSKVDKMTFTATSTMVNVTLLQFHTARGQRVQLTTAMALYNHS